jgi:hypothetical protein
VAFLPTSSLPPCDMTYQSLLRSDQPRDQLPIVSLFNTSASDC